VQVSIIDKSDLHKRLLRIDPEYYQQIYLENEKKISKKKIITLNDVCYITDGEHGTLKIYETGYAKYYGARNVLFGILDETSVEYITKEDHHRNKRSILHPHDVLISCVGTNIGCAAIVPTDIGNANIVRNVALLRSGSEKINNEYILSYFLSCYGKLSFKRVATGNAQPLISLDNISEIPIVLLNKKFQKLVSNVINKSILLREKAEKKYLETTLLLLSDIEVKKQLERRDNFFVKNYSETVKSDRIDAEYFQPKYSELIENIKKYSGGCDSLKNLVSIEKGIEIGSKKYLEKGIPFIRVRNLSQFNLTEEKYLSEELYNELIKYQPEKGEILLSKDGTPGIAHYLNKSPKKMILSNGILRLKIKNMKINEEYLTLVLNSFIVQEQIKRDAGGSVILHWRPDQINDTIIPILKEDIQIIIKNKTEETYIIRKKAKLLIQIAKKGVEIAIENNEKIAGNWINQELNRLDIT